VQEEAIARLQERTEELEQLGVGTGGGNASGHHFEVARDLPLGNLRDPPVVQDGLRIEPIEEGREERVQVVRIDGFGKDEMPLLLELLPDHSPVDLGLGAGSDERRHR
jgi:hypothetical protein